MARLRLTLPILRLPSFTRIAFSIAGRRPNSPTRVTASRQRLPLALEVELQGFRTISARLLSVDDVVEEPSR